MTAITKTSVKAYFQALDKPTEAQFIDLIDSYQDYFGILQAVGTAATSVAATGLVEITASAAVSVNPIGTFGKTFIGAGTTAAGIALLNISAAQTANETTFGVVEVATSAEAAAKTAVDRVITPSNIGSVAVLQGRQAVWIPGLATISRTTNGAGDGAWESATNKWNMRTKDFDTTTQEFIQFFLKMPPSWNVGTISAVFAFTATSGSGDAVLGMRSVGLSDTNAIDTAPGAIVNVTTGVSVAEAIRFTAETAAMTIGNTPAQNDIVGLEFLREPATSSDNLTTDARVVGILLFVTVSAATD